MDIIKIHSMHYETIKELRKSMFCCFEQGKCFDLGALQASQIKIGNFSYTAYDTVLWVDYIASRDMLKYWDPYSECDLTQGQSH